MLNWEQLQVEVADHVSTLCRDNFHRGSPQRKMYSHTYGTTMSFSPLANTHTHIDVSDTPTRHIPRVPSPPPEPLYERSQRAPLGDASNTYATTSSPRKLPDIKAYIHEVEMRMQDELARVCQRWEDRMTDALVRTQTNKIAIDRLALDVESVTKRSFALEERVGTVADVINNQATIVQRVESAQQRQITVNEHVAASLADASEQLMELERQMLASSRVVQRKPDRSEVEHMVMELSRVAKTKILEDVKDSTSLATSLSQMATKASQDAHRALKLLSRVFGPKDGGPTNTMDQLRALIDANAWSELRAFGAWESAATVAAPAERAAEANDAMDNTRVLFKKVADINRRVAEMDDRISVAMQQMSVTTGRHMAAEQGTADIDASVVRDLQASQAHIEASLRKDIKALEAMVRDDNEGLKKLNEGHARLCQSVNTHANNIESWVHTVDHRHDSHNKDMHQLRQEMTKKADEAVHTAEAQASALVRSERDARGAALKDMSKELQELYAMHTSLESRVQREMTKVAATAQELKSQAYGSTEQSHAAVTKAQELSDAVGQLSSQQASMRSMMEMTASVMVAMSQRTAELASQRLGPPQAAMASDGSYTSVSSLQALAPTPGPSSPTALGLTGSDHPHTRVPLEQSQHTPHTARGFPSTSSLVQLGQSGQGTGKRPGGSVSGPSGLTYSGSGAVRRPSAGTGAMLFASALTTTTAAAIFNSGAGGGGIGTSGTITGAPLSGHGHVSGSAAHTGGQLSGGNSGGL